MKCEYCDNIVDSNFSICPHCGANLPRVVVIKKTTMIPKNNGYEEKKKGRFINYFLYSVIGIGILLIILLIFLRYT